MRVALLGWCACLTACAKPTGTLSVINLSEQSLSGTADREAFQIGPQQAWTTKHLALGDHEVIMQGGTPITVAITEGHATIVDPSMTGCFAIADYRRQYGERSTGELQIVERFRAVQMFTPKSQLTVNFGEPLPDEVPEGSSVRRLHVVSCDTIDDEQQLTNTLARLP